MKLSLESSGPANRIRSYAPGAVMVNEERIVRSVIILPERIVRDWPPQVFADLHAVHIAALADLEPEIVLLGTGAEWRFLHPRITQLLLHRRIGLEVMNTAAACRTYNVLMGEGRRVAAALLMI